MTAIGSETWWETWWEAWWQDFCRDHGPVKKLRSRYLCPECRAVVETHYEDEIARLRHLNTVAGDAVTALRDARDAWRAVALGMQPLENYSRQQLVAKARALDAEVDE